MPQGIKDYFHFSKSERNGVFILLGLICVVLIIKQYFISFEPEYFPPREELAILQAKLDSLSNNKRLVNSNNTTRIKKKEEIKLTNFNPNDYTEKDWGNLGLSPKQTQVILNYKKKAGGFKSKEQVKKMFVISDQLYNQIEEFILLPDTLEKKVNISNDKKNWEKQKKLFSYEKKPLVKVLINTADTAMFKKLYGIGNVLSQRIVERREKLGGFYAKEQLQEIWGLKPEVLSQLDSLLVFHKVPLRKLNINSSTKEELKAHPYLYWKHANAIVNYRKQHGNYKELDDLRKIKVIPDSLLLKVKPYLSL